jgi:hypothetical protein
MGKSSLGILFDGDRSTIGNRPYQGGFVMPKRSRPYAAFLLLVVIAGTALAEGPGFGWAFTGVSRQAAGSAPRPAANAAPPSVACRAMEVFEAEPPGATAVIFHQRDKADGPRLGELLLAHSGHEVEFESNDGKRHRAMVFRVKSCFGRGLLVFASHEVKLAAKDNFVLRFD